MTCKECVHYVPCYEYGNILDPIHVGVKCDSFKSAADVVEVVRCAECKHLRVINGKELYAICAKTNLKFKPFDIDTRVHFCAYGERREE